MLAVSSINFNQKNAVKTKQPAVSQSQPSFGINPIKEEKLLSELASGKYGDAPKMLDDAIAYFKHLPDTVSFRLEESKVGSDLLSLRIENEGTGAFVKDIAVEKENTAQNFQSLLVAIQDVTAPNLVDFIQSKAGLCKKITINKPTRDALDNEHFHNYIGDVGLFKSKLTEVLPRTKGEVIIKTLADRGPKHIDVFDIGKGRILRVDKKNSGVILGSIS